MPSIEDQKAVLRRRMRMARDLVDDRELRSIDLWHRVVTMPEYAQAAVVMAFTGTRGEPDTDSLFARLAADGKTLALPSVEGESIVPRLLGGGFVPGPFGIPGPDGDVVPVESIDLVLVPGLAFTIAGARLGRGGGHYDRFLASLPAGCVSVGICFAEQLVDELPQAAHDVCVTRVISDSVPAEPMFTLEELHDAIEVVGRVVPPRLPGRA